MPNHKPGPREVTGNVADALDALIDPAHKEPVDACAWCSHKVHPRGQKCGVPIPSKNNKPCKCKAGGGWLDGLGNAIGESLFGGNR